MLTARRRARIRAATDEHVAALHRIGVPSIREQVEAMREAGDRQAAAWSTYCPNIAIPAFVGSAVAR
jgi:hypothetical protein